MISWPQLPHAIRNIADSRGRRREDHIAFVADRLQLVESARLAVVISSVQPTSSKRSIHGYGPCRHVTVIFPFEKAANDAIKAKLAPLLIEFDGYSKGWVLRAHTDAMVELIIKNLLKYFDALIVEDFQRYALVYR
jgi:hypothetical protein